MKTMIRAALLSALLPCLASGQVTQINNNNSLELVTPLNAIKTLFVSAIDQSPWISEGTLASTIQISNTIQMMGGGILLGEQYVFAGWTAATGEELFITDGTSTGTKLVKDIYPGYFSSPADFVVLNGVIYFSAVTAAEGRELWRTDGTEAGTYLVKDIYPGPQGSNFPYNYVPFPFGNLLFFAAEGNSSGVELWNTDGTANGTQMVLDINPGANTSFPQMFHIINNKLIFIAFTPAYGYEIWTTNGEAAGTTILKDINSGPTSSTHYDFDVEFLVTTAFHHFNGKAYFATCNQTGDPVLWSTDGTNENTTLVKEIKPITWFPAILMFNAINTPGKFFFTVADFDYTADMWQCDGTPAGTSIFKSFLSLAEEDIPLLWPNYGNGEFDQSLFQGNKFFFSARDQLVEGYELWISDGTLANTKLVKDINTHYDGAGIVSPSYMYTSNALFFAASNNILGNELWKTDGTTEGTMLVKDINPIAPNSDPQLAILHNKKIFFNATDGDHPTAFDLYVVDGEFTPLPSKLGDFTATPNGKDALLRWFTMQEINTDHFTVQRSFDGRNFTNIGTVKAAGNSANKRQYDYADAGVLSTAQGNVYYRLVMTDKDGAKSYSRTAVLLIKPDTWRVTLLGNAPGAPLSLLITGATQEVTVTLTDLSGRRVFSNKYAATNSPLMVQHPYMPAGVYNLTVTQGKESKTIRLIR